MLLESMLSFYIAGYATISSRDHLMLHAYEVKAAAGLKLRRSNAG